ncbi:MAG: hypothetical protein GQ537_10545 [Gammaproteobacteria bacterium]|nr:hypothetical protein [Gammaproteobacteria bacterium]
MNINYIQYFRITCWRHIVGALVMLMAALTWSFTAVAIAVLEIDLGDMFHNSELVFEGRVIGVESRTEQQSQGIRTYVTFDVLEVIKGSYSASTVKISFLGGSVNGITLRVADMALPKPGTTGIFFVESLTRRQVHPLYGWSQGHIAITVDSSGVQRVMTGDGRPIIAIDSMEQRSLLSRGLSTGVARGLQVEPKGRLSDAMTVEAFKLALDGLVSN